MKKLLFFLVLAYQSLFSYTNINNSELEQMMADDIVIIDVRLNEEWVESGVIKGSKLITYFDRENRPMLKEFLLLANKTLANNKSKPVVLVCRSGVRSIVASEALDKAGYRQVYNLKDGILGWLYERKKLVRYTPKQ